MTPTETTVKHTPGPWSIDTDRSILAPENYASPALHGVIAPVYSWMGSAEADANARLIAAAPELLAALREALLLAEHQLPCDGYIGDNPCICGYQKWWDLSNELIEKVAGAA